MVKFPCFPTAYWAEQSAQQVAIRWKGGNSSEITITWAELEQQIRQLISLLQARKIQPNTLVAYCGSHRLTDLLCYCAVLALGGRILMLNPQLTEFQQQQILAENGVEICLTDQDFIEISQNPPACLGEFCPEQPATFTLTSGSSGSPKAVVHSIQNHLDNAEGVCELMAFGNADSWLLSLPLFHVSGQGIVWRWLLQGATLVICEQKADFYPTLEQVSHASLVPTQLQRYLQTVSHHSHSQKILLGGASIPQNLVEQAKKQNVVTFSGYGMTEMASTICAEPQGLQTVGKPLKGRDVRIEQGEIWVRGAGLGLGYWKNPKILPLVNEQGWFATKDGGEWTSDGKLQVKGRLDNMFISGGENIQPEQIEKVLFQSNLLKNVFVVPIDDIEFGERPVALVEFETEFNEQAVGLLKIFAQQRLEKFKQPISYFPFDSEKWQQGGIKVSRKQLKEYVKEFKNDV
ncbi:o-succinylbenzoate--CoA ligase [Haemophilus paracuniculus]|uniref:O-succinylbenzoate--CoA ligase n=1 Tax=Haemophilus paracuniculus TaxID=734 RepID=A0A1T0AT91_9PAST|nr:o-succinylbenzoate--CoA ligase [Haemophilus paracuniculus]OOR99230.1 o-succinylbenzoate--CoA ligase [Haemophilus paracuniculus]